MDHGMYPGNKRSNEEMSIGPTDSKRNRNAQTPRTEYRFLIAASDANAIFGRGEIFRSLDCRHPFFSILAGEHFQSVRTKYHNQIDISQISTPERVLVLFGDEDRAMAILADLLPIMAQNQGVRPGFVELRAMIHSSQAGAVIVRSRSDLTRFRPTIF